ncbi:MAG: hypothetical protein CVU39_12440 [Chloroflexi bacterium HGW-Chloroflexi-10]|nr:MAG: hypothetical protein CVU39_12440 [Chloroflexi bacterium HGW-Chloroflexi-10]
MNDLVFALQISGIGIVLLLIALSLLAGLISLMTKYIVDKPEKTNEENSDVVETKAEVEEFVSDKKDLQLAAAIAVALYRAQLEITSVSTEQAGETMNSWRQFKLNRRLNQSSTIRRTR